MGTLWSIQSAVGSRKGRSSARTRWTRLGLAWVLAWGGFVLQPPAAASAVQYQAEGEEGALRVVKFGAPQPSAFYVVSSLIVGPSELILWDAQNTVSDGRRLAEEIAATGKHLKAILLSHADHDHYMGAMEVLRRFPGTPVYMTQAGLEDFKGRALGVLAKAKERGGGEVPDSIVTPRLLPEGRLEVDGYAVEVLEGLGGDVRGGKSTALWIPSIRTVLAGDLVFEGIHPWLGDADIQAREEWRSSLRRLAGLDPVAVVPGHKRHLNTPDSPDQIAFMLRYLDDYDTLMREAASPDALVEAMVQRYPDLELPALMAYGARRSFKR